MQLPQSLLPQTNQPPAPTPMPKWSYFILVPLDDKTIQSYNTHKDLEILLNATHKTLTPENTDVETVLGDGPMAPGNIVSIRIDLQYPLDDEVDVDGQYRSWLLGRAACEVEDWIIRYRELGEVPAAFGSLLADIFLADVF
ncbi:fungal-specific transcription factor domain-containing protein [Penicillium daleae]|uniref:Fungal-specific transcription factor domain-containing protein n=1 Tax=Penicillium daleae TaxID=63821 RepID=A0AAD6FZ69_9EURO|nr:fungal-specific transcription factor domain-containing protein [Penicillium daleae]KAJ5439588.1 fungal-specific transcription factor domain-containing protein [Penicillium daleae]